MVILLHGGPSGRGAFSGYPFYCIISATFFPAQVMKDSMGNTESQRRASFYDQQWCTEAVPRYFYAKVNQRKSELESALGIRHP